MTEALIITGSNMGNRKAYLTKAIEGLRDAAVFTTELSPLYETEPWGDIPQQNYYNQALIVKTKLSANLLLAAMLHVEQQLGRERGEQQYGPRTIDIDLLLYSTQIIQSPTLSIPHPRMHLRRFVLVPSFSIAPNWIHPVFQKTLFQLLKECTDNGKVELVLNNS